MTLYGRVILVEMVLSRGGQLEPLSVEGSAPLRGFARGTRGLPVLLPGRAPWSLRRYLSLKKQCLLGLCAPYGAPCGALSYGEREEHY